LNKQDSRTFTYIHCLFFNPQAHVNHAFDDIFGVYGFWSSEKHGLETPTTRLMAIFQENPDKPVQIVSILEFIGAKDDGGGEW